MINYSRRVLFLISGHVSVALAVVGIFLPVLPTVPFLLLASYCYARSSERFHQALHKHRIVGPILQNWEEHRSVSATTKAIAIMMVGAGIAVSCYFIPLLPVQIALTAIGLVVSVFILMQRTATV